MGWRNPSPGSFSATLRGVFESLGKYIDGVVCPAGTVRMGVSLVAEDGWIIMTGQTVTNGQFIYPKLWEKIPSDWQSGNNIVFPDFRNRFPINVAAGAAETDIGNLIGSHSSSLSVANLPSHTHGVNIASGTESALHVHTAGGGSIVVNTAGGGIYAGGIGGSIAGFTSTESAAHAHGVNGTSDATGSGTAFDTYPAAMYLQFYIRAF